MKKALLALCAISTLAACGGNIEKIAETPSGLPDVKFSQSKSVVQSKLAKLCLDKGWVVADQNDHSLVCQGWMDPGDDFLVNVFLKPDYATATELYVRFQTVTVSGSTRVQARQWMQWQNAFGQTQKHDLNGPAQFNSIQEQLYAIGGR